MVRSQDKTDQRFVNLHRTGQALTFKVPTGLKSCKDNFKDDLEEEQKEDRKENKVIEKI